MAAERVGSALYRPHHLPSRLVAHLRLWLGEWPEVLDTSGKVRVVGSEHRLEPGWDGHLHALVGVVSRAGGVISVAPDRVAATVRMLRNVPLDPVAMASALEVDAPVFRFSDAPTPGPDTGEWIPRTDQRVPQWLVPFNGDVLVAWDDEGRYGAGIGRKQHDDAGHEIAVGTEPALRGRGMARLLVATAARRVLDDGAIPTYLHQPDNVASARVADAAGFADRGFWALLSPESLD